MGDCIRLNRETLYSSVGKNAEETCGITCYCTLGNFNLEALDLMALAIECAGESLA